ncbi:hypothetical protein QAD02_018422 [Eretmocerus hayati]|uniref:Uncharacterized protein n=1 Tax=Eretmocerus hayati TaxID=131215 RepID=A0ACC2PGC7_9HYME|nr:hypothetical protein QAD02_018422 [Eretmocerus hayati]
MNDQETQPSTSEMKRALSPGPCVRLYLHGNSGADQDANLASQSIHVPVGLNKEFTIGRQLDNNFILENGCISRHHSKIKACGDTFLYKNVGSNMDRINDRMIKFDEGVVLNDGDFSSLADDTECCYLVVIISPKRQKHVEDANKIFCNLLSGLDGLKQEKESIANRIAYKKQLEQKIDIKIGNKLEEKEMICKKLDKCGKQLRLFEKEKEELQKSTKTMEEAMKKIDMQVVKKEGEMNTRMREEEEEARKQLIKGKEELEKKFREKKIKMEQWRISNVVSIENVKKEVSSALLPEWFEQSLAVNKNIAQNMIITDV